MLGRYAKAGALVAALLVLVVEGVLLIRYYDRYYGSDDASGTASGTPSGSAPAFEATMPEETMPEGTAPEQTTATGDVPSDESGAEETAFAHTTTDENSRGDYTYLSDPAIDGDPDAVVMVSGPTARGSDGGATYGHNVGVWFEPEARKWAIFNQDRTAVPAGAAFRVVLPRPQRASSTAPGP